MSTLTDKTRTPDPQAVAQLEAMETALHVIRGTMKPKAQARARDVLEAYATRLETIEGCRFPANVTPLRWSRREMALATEAQRRERAEQAAALRAVIGRAF